MINMIADKLRSARSVILSTHRNCDGDGLGAQIALYHALQKLGTGIRAQIVNLDPAPQKYEFLDTNQLIHVYRPGQTALGQVDLALIFDTNDTRLVEPLFTALKSASREVLFIDHHPILKRGPEPTPGSWIDTSAASTGELIYNLIRALGVALDVRISRALYTSLIFDTQLFRYVKGAPESHLMAADLLRHEKEPDEVHRHLFASYTVEKMAFLARALGQVEYFADNRVAFVCLHVGDWRVSGADLDESVDVIDLIMNIDSIEAAALLREDRPGDFKLSLRGKGELGVLPIAESFGGGGHTSSSGAYVRGSYEQLKARIIHELIQLVTAHPLHPKS